MQFSGNYDAGSMKLGNIAPIQNNLETQKVSVYDDDSESMQKLSELLASEDNQKALVSQIVTTWNQGLQARQDRQTIWEKCWLAYVMAKSSKIKQAEKDNPWTDYLILPWIFERVETACVELVNALLPNKEDFFDIQPQVTSDPAQEINAEVMNKYIKKRLSDNNFLLEFPKFIKQLVLCGNSVARVYNRESNNSFTIRERRLDGSEFKRKITRKVNMPIFETFDIQDFVVWPLNVNIEKSNVVQRVVVPICDIQRNQYEPDKNDSGYINVDKVKPSPSLTASSGNAYKDASNFKQSVNLAYGINEEGSAFSNDNDQVEMLEFWGTIKLGQDRFENVIVTVANREILLRVQKNPFGDKKPFIFTGYTPVPNQVYSIGLAEQLLAMWQAATTDLNLIQENTKLQVNNVYTMVVEEDPLINLSKIKFRPGAIIPVRTDGALKPLASGGNLSAGFTMMEWFKNQLDVTSAVSDVVRGAFPTPVQTATAVNRAGNNATKHFADTADHINSTSLVPTLKLFYDLVLEYATFEEIAEITGEDIDSLNQLFTFPLADYNVKITGITTSMEKMTAMEGFSSIWAVVASNPQLLACFDSVELVKYLLKLNGVDDPSQLLLPDEVLERMQENQLMPLLESPPIPGEEMLGMEEGGMPMEQMPPEGMM